MKLKRSIAIARALRSPKFLRWGSRRRRYLRIGKYRAVVAASARMSRDLAAEQHFTPAQLAALWGLSPETIRDLFEKEPGVIVIARTEPGKRRYRTFRIPKSVAERVHTRLAP